MGSEMCIRDRGCDDCFCGSIDRQRRLVDPVFRAPFTRNGVRLDLPAVVVDRRHNRIVLAKIAPSGRIVNSLFGVGFLCQRLELLDLETERRLKEFWRSGA